MKPRYQKSVWSIFGIDRRTQGIHQRKFPACEWQFFLRLAALIGLQLSVWADRSPFLIGLPPDPLTSLEDQRADYPFSLRLPGVAPERITVTFDPEYSQVHLSYLTNSGAGTNWTLQVRPGTNFNGSITNRILVRVDGQPVIAEAILVRILPVDDPPEFTTTVPLIVLHEGGPSTNVTLLVRYPDAVPLTLRLDPWVEPAPFGVVASQPFGSGSIRLTIAPTGNLQPKMLPFTRNLAVVAGNGAASVTHLITVTVLPRGFERQQFPVTLGSSATNQTAALASRVVLANLADDSAFGLDVISVGRSNNAITYSIGPGNRLTSTALPELNQSLLLTPGDFDGDGRVDVAAAQPDGAGYQLSVYSRPAGEWQRNPLLSGMTNRPNTLLSGDFDLDGWSDLRIRTATTIGVVNLKAEAGSIRPKGIPRLISGGSALGVIDQVYLPDGPLSATADLYGDGRQHWIETSLRDSLGDYLTPDLGASSDLYPFYPNHTRYAVGLIDVDGDGRIDFWELASSDPSSSRSDLPGSPRQVVVSRRVGPTVVELFRSPLVSRSAAVVPVWGDFDGDGSLDFVAATSEQTLGIFLNDGLGHFRPGPFLSVNPGPSAEHIPELPQLAAGDLNGDGLLDVVVGGTNGGIYLQRSGAANIPPSAPWGLRAEISGSVLMLSWQDAFDFNQTQALSYNIRIGTRPGANDILPSLSSANGTRRVAQLGNAGYANQWILDLSQREVGDLYWSVQAVDNGWAGGAWAPEETVVVQSPVGPPSFAGISDFAMDEDTIGELQFRVFDGVTPGSRLVVTATAQNSVGLARVAVVAKPGAAGTPSDDGIRFLEVTPQPNFSGSTIVELVVTDRSGLSTTKVVTVTVRPINHPPVISVSGNLYLLRGETSASAVVAVTDVDSLSSELGLRIGQVNGIGGTATATLKKVSDSWVLVVQPQGLETSEVRVELIASDSQSETRQTVTWHFDPMTWDAPIAVVQAPGWLEGFCLADVDGDGRTELVSWSSIQLRSRLVIAGFSGGTVFERDFDPISGVALADIDADGLPDLWVGSRYQVGKQVWLRVYRSLGSGQYEQVATGATYFKKNLKFSGAVEIWDRGGFGKRQAQVDYVPLTAPPGVGSANTFWPVSTRLLDFPGDGTTALVTPDIHFVEVGPTSRRPITGFVLKGFNDGSSVVLGIGDLNGDGFMDWVEKRDGFYLQLSRPEGGYDARALPGATSVSRIIDLDGNGRSDVLYRAGDHWERAEMNEVGEVVVTALPTPIAAAEELQVGDLNGDGVLDLVGRVGPVSDPTNKLIAFLGRTVKAPARLKPPVELTVALGPGNEAMLSWEPPNGLMRREGLTYAVRVGTSPGKLDRLEPDASSEGFRYNLWPGEIGESRKKLLRSLVLGQVYYWSVQAISPGFLGGEFSPEHSFTVPAETPVAVSLKVILLTNDLPISIPFFWNGLAAGKTPAVRISADNDVMVPPDRLHLSLSTTHGVVELTPIPGRLGSTILDIDVADIGSASVFRRQSVLVSSAPNSSWGNTIVLSMYPISLGSRFEFDPGTLDGVGTFHGLKPLGLPGWQVRSDGFWDIYPESMPYGGYQSMEVSIGPLGHQLDLNLSFRFDYPARTQLFRQRDGRIGLFGRITPALTGNSVALVEESENLQTWHLSDQVKADNANAFRLTNWKAAHSPSQFFRVRAQTP